MSKRFRSEGQGVAPSAPTHYHTPSEVGPIVVKAVIGFIALPVGWWGLNFLLDQAGIYRPQVVAAQCLLWVIGLIGGSLFMKVFVVDAYYRDHLDHQLALEKERTEQLRYTQLHTQSVVTDTRASGERQRLATLVYMVMLDAYDYVAKNGDFRGSWRPWSRRTAGEYLLVTLGETAPVGEALGAKARAFLERHEVVVDDQIDLGRYPDIASIQRLLYQPLLLKSPDTQGQGRGGKGATSWSITD